MCSLCDAGYERLTEMGLAEPGDRSEGELTIAGKVLAGLVGEYIFEKMAQATEFLAAPDEGGGLDIDI